MVPMDRFMTIMKPNWMGSIPRLFTMGRKIGVNMSRAGAMSIKVPTISSVILMINSMTIRLSEIPKSRLLMACGSPVKDRTKDSTEDAPIISMTMVVITAVSTSILGMSLI